MASTIQLDPADPGIAEVISGAKVGQELVLKEVRIVPANISATSFTGEVVGVSVEAAEEEEMDESPTTQEMPEEMKGMPMENVDTGMR